MFRPQVFKPSPPSPKRQAHRMSPALKYTAWVLIGVIILLGAMCVWISHELFAPFDHNRAATTVIIPRGLGMRAIVEALVRAEVIRFRLPTLVWLEISGTARSLKAGEYSFPSPITPMGVLARIERGDVVRHKIVVPEGHNRFDIASTLAQTGLTDERTFRSMMDEPALIRTLDPAATSLEGYLFPDTYLYNSETSPRELVSGMVARFREVFTPQLQAFASSRNLTVHQVVTMASMIEKEARLDKERPLISAVFYNRLKKGIPLASDPTFVYSAVLAGDWDGDVNNPRYRQRNSPYNTYFHAGLPPGPIASPGTKSIMAALYPAQADYLYFVADGSTGGHLFSRTEKEHQRNVALYRKQRRMMQLP